MQWEKAMLSKGCRKELENVGILKKKGGGVYPNPTSIFTVFNMGDPPTINVPKVLKCKINHNLFSHKRVISKQGGGGSATWEKFPHFPVFFWETSLIRCCSLIVFCCSFVFPLLFKNKKCGKAQTECRYEYAKVCFFLIKMLFPNCKSLYFVVVPSGEKPNT